MFRPKTAKRAIDPNQCIAARCEEATVVTPEQQAAYGCPPLCQAHGQEWEAAGRPSLEDMRKRPPRAGDKPATPEADPANTPAAIAEREAAGQKAAKKPRTSKSGPSELEKQLAERGPQLTASLAFLQANEQQPAEWFNAALGQVEEQRKAYVTWQESLAFEAQERYKAELEKLGGMFRPLLDTLDACEALCRSKLPQVQIRWRVVEGAKLPREFRDEKGDPYPQVIDLYIKSRGKEAARQIGIEVAE